MAAALVFGLGLPGFVAAQTAATPEAALVAGALGGKAKAAGDTVTLSGKATLKAGLAIPAGVTLIVSKGAALDLTKAALQLADNATLTVDGTVNAKAQGITIDGAAAINGSGTISLKSKGQLLSIENGKKLTLDGAMLVGLKANNNPLVTVEKSGELVMKSGTISGNALTEGWTFGGGVRVNEGGVFTMSGGTISGNTAQGNWSGGGGVAVMTNSAFTMSGGTISGNTTGGRGGGVVVVIKSTFTISGGAISGNNAGNGGGVAAFNADNKGGGTFIMKGGAISGNMAKHGGGVDIAESVFTLSGGRVQGGVDSDGFAANLADESWWSHTISAWKSTAKWGTGGKYTVLGYVTSDGNTIGSVAGEVKAGGTDLVDIEKDGYGSRMETLIAVPK